MGNGVTILTWAGIELNAQRCTLPEQRRLELAPRIDNPGQRVIDRGQGPVGPITAQVTLGHLTPSAQAAAIEELRATFGQQDVLIHPTVGPFLLYLESMVTTTTPATTTLALRWEEDQPEESVPRPSGPAEAEAIADEIKAVVPNDTATIEAIDAALQAIDFTIADESPERATPGADAVRRARSAYTGNSPQDAEVYQQLSRLADIVVATGATYRAPPAREIYLPGNTSIALVARRYGRSGDFELDLAAIVAANPEQSPLGFVGTIQIPLP